MNNWYEGLGWVVTIILIMGLGTALMSMAGDCVIDRIGDTWLDNKELQ